MSIINKMKCTSTYFDPTKWVIDLNRQTPMSSDLNTILKSSWPIKLSVDRLILKDIQAFQTVSDNRMAFLLSYSKNIRIMQETKLQRRHVERVKWWMEQLGNWNRTFIWVWRDWILFIWVHIWIIKVPGWKIMMSLAPCLMVSTVFPAKNKAGSTTRCF